MDLPPSPAPAPPRSNLLHWVIALGLAGVLLYYSLRGIDWHQVWSTLATTRLDYVSGFMIVTTGSLFLRALRWRVLLQAGGPVRVPTAFWATCAGYFGNSFLPARAGELIRSMAIDAETGIGRTFILTTALAERIVDAIALVLISSLVLLTLPVRPGWYATAAKPFAILGIAGVLGPYVALTLGLGLVIFTIRRLMRPRAVSPNGPPVDPETLARIEKDTANLD